MSTADGRLVAGFKFPAGVCFLSSYLQEKERKGREGRGGIDRVHRRALDMEHGRRRLLDLKQCSWNRWVSPQGSAIMLSRVADGTPRAGMAMRAIGCLRSVLNPSSSI